MTRDEIFSTISEILSESFELDKAEITPASKLYEELGLDSIDAVDIFVQLREVTGRRPDPTIAREIRTVGELITFVENELAAAAAGVPEPDVPRPAPAGGDPRAPQIAAPQPAPAAATATATATAATVAVPGAPKKASGGRA